MTNPAKQKPSSTATPLKGPVSKAAGRKAGRPKFDDLEKRASELLAVAEEALVEFGYEGVTLSLIAERAGVSKQTIYAKYGGKVGLLRAVLTRIANNAAGAGFPEIEDLSLEDGLFERARMMLAIQQLPSAKAIIAISVREGPRFPEFIAEIVEAERIHQRDPVSRYLQRLQARGLIGEMDCDKIAASFLWLLAENSVQALTRGEHWSPSQVQIEERARFIAKLIASGVSAGTDKTPQTNPPPAAPIRHSGVS